MRDKKDDSGFDELVGSGEALPILTAQQILDRMAIAVAECDWQSWYFLLELVRSMDSPDERAAVLNELLVMPGHQLHQEVTREIQDLRHPSSVAYIHRVLSAGFSMFDYTCSEPGVIAKWFSHALADIETPEAIAVIREFARRGGPGVAEEMIYRLQQIDARRTL